MSEDRIKVELAGKKFEIVPFTLPEPKDIQVTPPGKIKLTLKKGVDIFDFIDNRNDFVLTVNKITTYKVIRMRKLPNQNAYHLYHGGGYRMGVYCE